MLPNSDPAKPLRAKVIYNPAPGAATESPERLLAIVGDLQALNLLPEVYLVNPEPELGLAGDHHQRWRIGSFATLIHA